MQKGIDIKYKFRKVKPIITIRHSLYEFDQLAFNTLMSTNTNTSTVPNTSYIFVDVSVINAS
jgi:hypothetical protein